MMLQLI